MAPWVKMETAGGGDGHRIDVGGKDMALSRVLPHLMSSAISPSGCFPHQSFDAEQAYVVAAPEWNVTSTDHIQRSTQKRNRFGEQTQS